jgi:hypothetical protein
MALRNSKCLSKRLRSGLKKLQFLTKRVFCSKEKLITNMVYLIKFFYQKQKSLKTTPTCKYSELIKFK